MLLAFVTGVLQKKLRTGFVHYPHRSHLLILEEGRDEERVKRLGMGKAFVVYTDNLSFLISWQHVLITGFIRNSRTPL